MLALSISQILSSHFEMSLFILYHLQSPPPSHRVIAADLYCMCTLQRAELPLLHSSSSASQSPPSLPCLAPLCLELIPLPLLKYEPQKVAIIDERPVIAPCEVVQIMTLS